MATDKLSRLAEVKARAAVRTRNRLAQQDEEAQVRAEAARQIELAKVQKERDAAERKQRDQLNKQLEEESKKSQNVNPEPEQKPVNTSEAEKLKNEGKTTADRSLVGKKESK